MTMKRTELEKRKALTIVNAQRRAGNPFGPAQAGADDRKARRERERAAGLVPVALKLPKALVEVLRARAQGEGRELDALLAQLLQDALQAGAPRE